MSEFTPWFPVAMKPVRPGEYEGRERGTRQRIAVHWRKLEDTDYFDWYLQKGFWGPFALWEAASNKITAWRGLAAAQGDKP